ncbi:MAG: hypothetical protein KGL01_09350 [Betaproteobacteria bacterium]|nr:hypothetical protein [Betaproteobacteria bacterium]
MASKTLMFLGADHFHAYTWKNGALSGEQRFADNPEGKEQFVEFLQNHPDPAYLLADLIEEDFRHETVPHLRGGERTALIQRKFDQYYRNTPFRQALPLQRRKEGRRDDEMLFSGLTNPALISPWLSVLLAHSTPVAGIYSVPNISAPLVRDIPSSYLLLLSWEKYAGLRQTYFDAKLLRFSRLTPISDGSSFSEAVAKEAARTQQYLKSLSLLPAGQALSVYIICHADDRHELEARLNDNTDMHYAYLDIQEMGQRIKSKTRYADSDAAPLFLHLLAIKPPPSHYAAAAHTHFFQLMQFRRGLYWLSGALAAASLLWSAADIWEGRGLNADGKSLKAQADKISQQAQQVIQSFPNTLVPATDMKTAVLLARKLENYSPAPQIILEGLSKALDAFPRIRVDKLSWQTSAAPDSVIPGRAATNAPAQVITLDGELTEFSGDYRNALNYLERFQQALAQRGYGVTALALPLDISPKGSIAAGAGDDDTKPAKFSLKIIWRLAA